MKIKHLKKLVMVCNMKTKSHLVRGEEFYMDKHEENVMLLERKANGLNPRLPQRRVKISMRARTSDYAS